MPKPFFFFFFEVLSSCDWLDEAELELLSAEAELELLDAASFTWGGALAGCAPSLAAVSAPSLAAAPEFAAGACVPDCVAGWEAGCAGEAAAFASGVGFSSPMPEGGGGAAFAPALPVDVAEGEAAAAVDDPGAVALGGASERGTG